MKNKGQVFYLFLPIAISSILFIGYRFAVSDQCIYIPIMRRILDSSLYPGDYLFYQPSGKYSILLPIVAYLSELLTMQWVFFMGYVIAITGLFWAVYRIAFSFSKSREVACIAILLLCISRRQDQAIITQETFFTLQPVAMPFSLMTLYFFIRGRYKLAVAFNAIAFLIHPIAAAPPFILLAFYLVFSVRRLGLRTVLKTFGVFLLITAPILVWASISRSSGFRGASFFRIASREWMGILYGRNTYAFPPLWNRSSWERLFSICLLLVVSMFLKIMYTEAGERDKKALWIVTASLGCLGMAYLFGSVIPVPLFFQLQLARGLYMLMYIAFIYAAYVVWIGYSSHDSIDAKGIVIVSAAAIATGDPLLVALGVLASITIWLRKKLPNIARASGIVMSGIILYFSSRNFVFGVVVCTPVALFMVAEILKAVKVMQRKSINRFVAIYIILIAVTAAKLHKDSLRVEFPYSKPPDTWTQAQLWASENTPEESVFIVPPDTSGFRNFSKRAIVGDRKDGAPGLFSESYDLEWARRMKQLQSYGEFRDKDFMKLAEEYKASFAVTLRNHELGFQRVYENSDFHVYQLQ